VLDERIQRTIRNISRIEDLAQFEKNAERRGALSNEVRQAIDLQTAQLGRALVAGKLGISLEGLTPAEERIVEAAATYAGIKKRTGSNSERMFQQLRNKGLIGAAESAVAKSKPTMGFETLNEENLADLSYEKIIIDHPEEFTDRALWYARRTLGLPNATDKPPASGEKLVQTQTEALLLWLEERALTNAGRMPSFSNVEAAAAIGMGDLSRSGRAYGNIQSRLDFACYQAGLPALGLTADAPFDDAWSQQDRDWPFPVPTMQIAAKDRVWSRSDFAKVRRRAKALPGQAHVAWKRELLENPQAVRDWAHGLARIDDDADPEEISSTIPKGRNPNWTREEHILALDAYLRLRGTSYSPTSPEILALSSTLLQLARLRGMSGTATFRNPAGVSMKMMNFRACDPEYTVDGKVGLERGSGIEEDIWAEFASDRAGLAAAVFEIEREIAEAAGDAEAPYWVFVCNPKKWAVDRFLAGGAELDSWGVRPSDASRFAPGQLGVIRVGVDTRTLAELAGAPRLESGIYALCEVESETYPGTGASDEFWAEGSAREAGWPTVKIRYLSSYAAKPLTIERLRAERPDISHLLLNGFQASSFPISKADFHAVMGMLGEDLGRLPGAPADVTTFDDLAALEARYVDASPEVKTRVSKYIERGPIGAAVKRANGFKCQICELLGENPIGFSKRNGEAYIEAHHVMPVARRVVGSLSCSNIMTLCANHHRQMHFGNVSVSIGATHFDVDLDGLKIAVLRTLVER
jgi:predicted HNH restriction endonuclease